MEIPYYSIEFFVRKNNQGLNYEISAFEKVFERFIPSDINANNINWYMEHGNKNLTESRAYAVEYYKAFLNYRIGNRTYFGNWDNDKLLPIIELYNSSIDNIWVAIFLNIQDKDFILQKKIEISGTFEKGKWQLFRLSEELKFIEKFTGSTFKFELPFYYYCYPTDAETLLLNNSEAYTIIYDLNIQIIDFTTKIALVTIQKTFETRDPLINRKLAL